MVFMNRSSVLLGLRKWVVARRRRMFAHKKTPEMLWLQRRKERERSHALTRCGGGVLHRDPRLYGLLRKGVIFIAFTAVFSSLNAVDPLIASTMRV